MARISIKTAINDEKFLFKGIKKKNKIIYKDNDISVMIDISNIVVLTRENLDFKINLIFDEKENTKGFYLLKSSNNYLELQIKTEKLVVLENSIEIIYNINSNEETINFKLEFEAI